MPDSDPVARSEADALLKGVAGVERRTRAALIYVRAGDYLILWGVLWALGYGFGATLWPHMGAFWWILDAIGVAGTAIITYRAARCSEAGRRFVFLRPLIGVIVLIGFGTLWIRLAHFGGREQAAFWPTLCGALLFVFGLWAGRALSIAAAAVFALTMAGYVWTGPWFDLWLAVTCGGALILGGFWLRR
ncbi:MAG TPA: hypothetical protein VGB91_17400 [Rhizomicrobium sp.]